MQTIVTKYLGHTNHRPARIRATATNGTTIIVPESYDHIGACGTLREKLGWVKAEGYGPMISGDTKDGKVWVFLPKPRDACDSYDIVDN